MKLVELLARELSEWPKRTVQYVQGRDGCWPLAFDGARFEGNTWILKSGQTTGSKGEVLHIDMASDYKTAQVTRAQWQAERDRQKGGEWKRHRGGKQPIFGGKVEVKFRDGDVEEWFSDSLCWNHNGKGRDIMKYKIISQPQAEEVEVATDKKWYEPEESPDTREYKGPFPCAPAGEPVTDLEWDIQFQQGIFHMEAKTDQIDGPIKWRDQIVELEAHEEDIQREIASLHARITSEGFQLIRQYPSVKQTEPSLDMSDWRNLKVGDVIECSEDGAWISSWAGKHVIVAEVEPSDYDGDLPIRVLNGESDDWGRGYTFVSRP